MMEEATRRLLQAMSDDQLNAFLEAVKTDAVLQERLKAAGEPEDIIAIAKAAGYEISIDATQSETESRRNYGLSDEELENVGGGCGIFSRIVETGFLCTGRIFYC